MLTPRKDSKLGPAHWLRVIVILLIIAVLTWYGKFHKPTLRISRDHGVAVWMVPVNDGLAALLVLPDDGNDSNSVKTGTRIWLGPPRDQAPLYSGGIRYLGGKMVLLGDSLDLSALSQAAATVDTGGHVLWIGSAGWPEHLVREAAGPRQFTHGSPAVGDFSWIPAEWIGNDVELSVRFLGDNSRDYIVELGYEGQKLRFWSSEKALAADSGHGPLGVGVLMFRIAEGAEIPLLHSKEVQTLIWHGNAGSGTDSTRIVLGAPESMALAATDKGWNTLQVRRMHLRHWNPREQ